MATIEKNDSKLNISRDISKTVGEAEIDLSAIHADLSRIESDIAQANQHQHISAGIGFGAITVMRWHG
jgi:hypothetical protein